MNIQLKSDAGRVRSSNQDAMTAFTLDRQGLFAAVCDGMGGANGGNVASDICVHTLENYIHTNYHPDQSDDEICSLLTEALNHANAAVYQRAQENVELTGMGTTAVMALIRGESLTVANVGDSRAILYHEDAIVQLTRDHSYVQAMVDSGRITEEQAETHPQKHIITRAIGVHDGVEADLFRLEFHPGDLLILCSDGLTNELRYDALAQLIRTAPRGKLAEELVAQANRNGGHDNSTVVLVEA